MSGIYVHFRLTYNLHPPSSIIHPQSYILQGASKKCLIAKFDFWVPIETVCSFLWYLVHLSRIPGLVYVPNEQFLWPYSAPYSPFSPYSQSFFILLFSCEKHHNFMIGDLDYYCRGCRVHWRVTKIVSLVHRPTLVSYTNVPSIIVRSKQSL